MNDVMIEISHVVKEYELGAIGGTTLKRELQSKLAKLRHKEDPNSLVGSKQVEKTGEIFRALDDINLTVRKGEALGIIGHNGAGKSTLLKLLSRVTAPTYGEIGYNGRIASMLEVGTGFHPELTGRENVYLNGTILGMTKAEIDAKFDEIVKFAEMERFIDTPVKRYSSGMYVKLAFAVAAHLDNEILVMDEVLAVGDAKFQQKCLGKMGDVANHEGKTVLYVSHNMSTIRSLCTRCIVMDHGKIIFDGDTEEAIAIYSETGKMETFTEKDLTEVPRYSEVAVARSASFSYMKLLNKETNVYKNGENLRVELTIDSEKEIANPCIRFVFKGMGGYAVAFALALDLENINVGKNKYIVEMSLEKLTQGVYDVTLVLLEKNEYGASTEIDVAYAFAFEMSDAKDLICNPWAWGFIRLSDMEVMKIDN